MSLSSEYQSVFVTAHRYLDKSLANAGPTGESLVENRHWGWMVITHRHNGLLYFTPGAPDVATFFRSSAKPFQAFPLVESGLYKELTTSELAIACASHTGTHQHVELGRSILQKAGLPETCLQCGPHAPLNAAMNEYLRQSEKSPTAIHNNCSGKHAGMLFYCARHGLDPNTYLEPSHPLQQQILSALRRWGKVDEIPLAIDGCGAPVFYLPLQTMALLYAHLGSDEAFHPLREAMVEHPEVIGGAGRVDTVIMQAGEGKLLAKVGADGVMCVSRVGSDEGLALKIADGSELIRNMATVEALIRLGWLDADAASDPRLLPFLDKTRFNTQDKAVGEYQVHYPPKGDS